MKRLLIGPALAVMVAILLMSVGLSAQRSEGPLPNGAPQINAGVTPPQSVYLGMTYGEWAAAWWQWAFALPLDSNHPLNDVTGANAAVGQMGKVWFLGGLWWASGGTPPPVGPVTRNITVPAGTSLFFPIANGENTFPEQPTTRNITELWATNDWFYSWRDENMYATIDGRKLHQLTSYMTNSPLFKVWLPYENNAFQMWGVTPTPGMGVAVEQNGAGENFYTLSPSAARGFFLMVEPLPVGRHRITFGVKNVGWSLDIVYHITVVPAT
jgi:hypothetical protein